MNKAILCPPWCSLNRKLKCTIGNNPHVTVSDLIRNSPICYETDIFIDDLSIAKATRNILPTVYNFLNVNMKLMIYYNKSLISSSYKDKYTSKEVSDLFTTALNSNNLFKYVIIPSHNICLNNYCFPIYKAIIIIKKSIVQFYNDDLSDIYLNTNEIASQSFNSISILEFPKDIYVHFNTENDRCTQ
ncbi:hypothetical protein G8S49_12090 [Clostridium botulinum C]|uniref:Uncharacterized protein n=2 Tax=Clostridium botulinum TaxID=1491 RepID=A0A9Q4THT4_CLOBO|nr:MULTISPECIES: hypothetical protein [Clostridium]EGO88426.1 hypothetical protein CBCST_05628 [Clostridium botulinum C str. Stockholm]AYF54240.1 hypothetical protein DFH04_05675 [Clostridium novyi]MCD3195876.1 hypothetical protein [Clostridium botulinum C]MCD3201292.1 hypothetical protein [Clostridium botulinum C]MCD3206685.1 hypothetical protein [Clostridium botulinum C]